MSCDQNGNEIYVQQNDNELYVQQNDNDIFIQRNNNDFYEKRTSSFCCKKGKAVSHLLPTSPAAYVTITSVLCLLIAAGYIYQDLNFKLLTLQKQLDAYTTITRRSKRQLNFPNFITTSHPDSDYDLRQSLWSSPFPDLDSSPVDDVSPLRSFGLEGFTSILTGSTYIRWGRLSCPQMSSLVYSGYISGPISSRYSTSGTDLQCIPKDYDHITGSPHDMNDQITPNSTNTILATATFDHRENKDLRNREIACALCLIHKSSQIMIPNGKHCPSDWIKEYDGWLMTSSGSKRDKALSSHICIDRVTTVRDVLSEFTPSLQLSRIQQGTCVVGSSLNNCRTFENLRHVPCVVCSTT